jgi:type II secretory pathway component GspD/PulD (secretin)
MIEFSDKQNTARRNMINKLWQRKKVLIGIVSFWVCAAVQVHAQAQLQPQRPAAASSSTTSSRPYVPNGTIGDAVISSDPDTKQITVIADDETAQYIKQVIHGLDRPKPQVLIKVVFLEVEYDNASDIGVDSTIAGKLKGSTTGVASNIFGILSSGAAPIPPGAGLYTILGNDFSATLRLIATAGKTEILSRPSILARNNQQATINLGQQVPLITATRFDSLGNQINSISYQNVGISLQVTPFITPEGFVEMIVSPSTSELADKSQWVPISSGTGGTISAPVINSRSADTVVVVPDGQTVIIGGLMENQKVSSESKIPILGDIPLIGNAFKRQTKAYTKTELIIFLTPHVVAQPLQLAGLTAREQANAQLAPKAFTEQELNRFLDNLPVKGRATNSVNRSGSKPMKSAQ